MSDLLEEKTAAVLQEFLQGYWGRPAKKAEQPPARRLGVRFRTRTPFDRVEAWLEANCKDRWDVAIIGIVEGEDGRLWKQLEVTFDSAADRTRFREHLANSR